MTLTFAEIALIASMATNMQADLDHEELICMARNVYHEARGEDRSGQIAVAYLTLNRVESDRYPDTVCGVVTEDRGPKSNDCQFSWWCDGKSDTPNDLEAYQNAIRISIEAMTGTVENPVPGATHYYAPKRVTPGWSYKLAEVAVIGDHRFMEE
ncbi:cell wall hydrolase [Phaeobacter gallaeciensis]|uniref:cell wall hydrolase n=1 Tax=Phaeobacter gallaeciensis TaxID=60890 RepID=UPI0023807D5D|nr:cell wall hydrolase [Phaeobacter gallaeciensis]MDE4297152.1 cell wall hydrolase [Phaeobacter gallaeciensis]